MSYQLIRETTPRARKEYHCIWCPEKINPGERHVHEVSRADDFQDHRWHPECRTAANEYFRESGEDDFAAHACKRGTSEER